METTEGKKRTKRNQRKNRTPWGTPLTNALLAVAEAGIFFCTPGHRIGRAVGLGVAKEAGHAA
ncbi:hypothetical protein ACFLQ0_03480 [Nitrospinota bacterium]